MLAAVSLAEAKATSVSSSGPPASADLVWDAVYWLTRSAALTVLGSRDEQHQGEDQPEAERRPGPA